MAICTVASVIWNQTWKPICSIVFMVFVATMCNVHPSTAHAHLILIMSVGVCANLSCHCDYARCQADNKRYQHEIDMTLYCYFSYVHRCAVCNQRVHANDVDSRSRLQFFFPLRSAKLIRLYVWWIAPIIALKFANGILQMVDFYTKCNVSVCFFRL